MAIGNKGEGGSLILVTTLVQSAGIYAQHLPSTFELRKQDATPESFDDVQKQLFMSHALVLGLGGLASILTKNAAPLAGAVALAVLIHGVYTWALVEPGRGERNQEADDLKAASLPTG